MDDVASKLTSGIHDDPTPIVVEYATQFAGDVLPRDWLHAATERLDSLYNEAPQFDYDRAALAVVDELHHRLHHLLQEPIARSLVEVARNGTEIIPGTDSLPPITLHSFGGRYAQSVQCLDRHGHPMAVCGPGPNVVWRYTFSDGSVAYVRDGRSGLKLEDVLQ